MVDDRALMDRVRTRLEAAFAGFDWAVISAGARVRDHVPEVSAWSVLDVAEHVSLTNRSLLVLAEKCARKSAAKLARGAAAEDERSEIGRLERIAGRDFHWDAPAHMVPTGKVALDAVRATLAEQKHAALSLLDALPRGSRRLHTIRMAFVEPDMRLDALELVAFMALHIERHTAQVQRIMNGTRRQAP
jgi:hypothetical protein